jgi:hypothetical protein
MENTSNIGHYHYQGNIIIAIVQRTGGLDELNPAI